MRIAKNKTRDSMLLLLTPHKLLTQWAGQDYDLFRNDLAVFKFLQMAIQLHVNQRGHIRFNAVLSEPFPITIGVKRSCILEPTLFNIFFSVMLRQSTDNEDGAYVRYRLNGSPFNPRCLQAYTRTFFLRTTLPSSPTQNKFCSTSHLALRTPRNCLALRTVSGRLR